MELFEIASFSISNHSITADIDKHPLHAGTLEQQLASIMLEPTSTGGMISIIANIAKAYLDGESLRLQFDQLGERFESIVRDAIQEINAHTSKAILDSRIDEIQASLSAVKMHLEDYEGASIKEDARLTLAEGKSADAYTGSEGIGFVAIFPYISATSFKLLVHLVKYKSRKDTGELMRARDLIARTIPIVQNFANQAVEIWNTRIAAVTSIEAWTVKPPCSRCMVECREPYQVGRFYDHGTQSQYLDDLGTVTSKRNELLSYYNTKRQEMIDTVVGPTSIAISRWEAALSDGSNAILRIEC